MAEAKEAKKAAQLSIKEMVDDVEASGASRVLVKALRAMADKLEPVADKK